MATHSSDIDDLHGDVAVAPAEPEAKLRRPSRWQVVVLNDDFTPMDFVVRVLMEVFDLPYPAATLIMYSIHHRGQGVAGLYSREIAETKKAEMEHQAQSEGHPLRAILQPVDSDDGSRRD
jgi:ATP-dependent Clp protease adaptor protein ClpS